MTDQIRENDNQLKKLEKEIVDFYIRSGSSRTLTTKFSTIYGYFLTRGDLSQKDIKKLTNFSAGTIFKIINVLEEEYKIIERYKMPGVREKRYKLKLDVSQVSSSLKSFASSFLGGFRNFFETIDPKLKQIQKKFSSLKQSDLGESLESKQILDKIDRINQFRTEINNVISVVENISNLLSQEVDRLG